MDLNEISREQALLDIDVANARILDLSLRIENASLELMGLRADLAELDRVAETANSASAAKLEKLESNPGTYTHYVKLISKKFGSKQKARMLIANLDEVCGRPVKNDGSMAKHSVASREFRALTIKGWAIPRNFPGYFTSFEVVLRGQGTSIRSKVPATPREDVARHFSNTSIERAGFAVDFPMATLKKGQYTVELHGQTENGATASAEVLTLDVN